MHRHHTAAFAPGDDETPGAGQRPRPQARAGGVRNFKARRALFDDFLGESQLRGDERFARIPLERAGERTIALRVTLDLLARQHSAGDAAGKNFRIVRAAAQKKFAEPGGIDRLRRDDAPQTLAVEKHFQFLFADIDGQNRFFARRRNPGRSEIAEFLVLEHVPEQQKILPAVVRRILLKSEIPVLHAARGEKAAVFFLRDRLVDAHLDGDVAGDGYAHALRQQLRCAAERNRRAGIGKPEHRILGNDGITAESAKRRVSRLHRRSSTEIAPDDGAPIAGGNLLRAEHRCGYFDFAVPNVAVNAVGDFYAFNLPFARGKSVSGIVLPRIGAPGRIDHQLELAETGEFGAAGALGRIEPEFERIGVENRIIRSDRLEDSARCGGRTHGEAQSLFIPGDGAFGLAGVDNRLLLCDVRAAPVRSSGKRHRPLVFTGGDYAVRLWRTPGLGNRVDVGTLRRERQKHRQNAADKTHHIAYFS